MAGQGFELIHDGRVHRVDVTDAGLTRVYVWSRDGAVVATQKTMDDRPTLTPDEAEADQSGEPGEPGGLGEFGEVRVRAGLTGVQRATLVADGEEVDLVPDPGSWAARREERIRNHPNRHVLLHTTAALAKVLIPLLGVGLVLSFLPDWDLPRIPLPDWDLPSIPWPDWQLPRFEVEVPAWLRAILDKLKYVWPVLLALGLAQREVKRRRQQDERRASSTQAPSSDDD